ncbi:MULTISPECIES: lytic transglycosylase domain-containing protein [unclassified Sphingobium]|uniref:lytic transglycosylase domain-containing protein n=1 Tax=unclassified Sphingobium TaxID=2611147 RepID=UPI0035A6E9A3
MSGVFRNAAGALALLAATASVAAKPASSLAANGCALHAPEAATRSGLSIEVVLRVMMAESGGRPRVVSPKGAKGCMQIMPATWAYLTAHYRLGPDPFDARMNMIGGAMYLAELVSRYGAAGAIAAYNAGPGRYERYISGSTPLPAETIAYAARIGSPVTRGAVPTAAPRWQEAQLFLSRAIASDRAEISQPSGPPGKSTRRDRLFPLATFREAENESAASQ